MPDIPELSASKRALLEKYLRGELPKSGMTAPVITRSAQAGLLSPSSIAPRVSLIPVQTSGSKRPFFYMHVHWIGGAFYSFVLAHDLGSDQPLYIIDPYKFDDLSVPPTIEAMAAAYVKSIRSVQPEGPYFLGGFCAGGLLAYEVSQQLCTVGQVVDSLILIDPMAGPIQSLRLLGSFIRTVGSLIHLKPSKQLDWFLRLRYISRILRRAQDENTEHVNQLLHRWQIEHPRRFTLLPAAEALRQDWMAVFAWAVSGYFPRKYPGKMTYLLARENPDRRHLWWGEIAESEHVEILSIPGTHETCRTTHLHEMTQQLRRCLSKAQANTWKE